MKGITPVVAVILLLLVTIAVVGFAFGFFQRILGITGSAGENQTQEAILRGAKTISIDHANLTGVAIRNTGTQTIVAADLNVFVGTVLGTCTWSPPLPLVVRLTSTCTLASNCVNSIIRVVAPGNEDSKRC